jgi:3-dehydroquinate dehydratase-1
VFDNATWRGILSTLTRDMAPSAYAGRAAVVLAGAADDAASAIFALKALRVGKIYTAGFRTPPALARDLLVEPFNSLESLQRARMVSGDGSGVGGDASPFVIVSALGPDKGNLVGMLLRVFGAAGPPPPTATTTAASVVAGAPATSRGPAPAAVAAAASSPRKVFLDLADGPRKFGDLEPVARQSGFAAYGAADVSAFTTVETLRLLVGQNVPYSFVRLASGRGLY